MKKHFLLVLVSVLFVSLFAACSSNSSDDERKLASTEETVEINEEGFPIVDEKITISLMAPGTGVEDWANMETLQNIQR